MEGRCIFVRRLLSSCPSIVVATSTRLHQAREFMPHLLESLGTQGRVDHWICGHMVHPNCVLSIMMNTLRWPQCKAPLHCMLHEQFGVQQ